MSVQEKPQVFLESDDEIRGQKYVCLSFLTPNRGVLKRKDLYFFSEFLKFYALDYKIKATETFLMTQFRDVQNTLSDAVLNLTNTDFSDVSGALAAKKDVIAAIEKQRAALSQKAGADLEAHVKANMSDFRESTIIEEYERWMVVNRQRLEDLFHKEQNFQTTIHGLKVRGVYSNQEQASARAKALNKKDPYFNVYVADVGEWLPWDPEPEEVADSEYQNDDLNKLMQAYKKNAAEKEAWFEEEKRHKMAAAAAAAAAGKSAALVNKDGGKQGPATSDLRKQGPVFGEQGKEEDATLTASAVADEMFVNGPADLSMARKVPAPDATISHS